MVGGLFVNCAGRGPRVVLLHGGVLAGELCWSQQLQLADRFALEIVDRAGYGRSQQVSPVRISMPTRRWWPGCWQNERTWWATRQVRWPPCWPPPCGPRPCCR